MKIRPMAVVALVFALLATACNVHGGDNYDSDGPASGADQCQMFWKHGQYDAGGAQVADETGVVAQADVQFGDNIAGCLQVNICLDTNSTISGNATGCETIPAPYSPGQTFTYSRHDVGYPATMTAIDAKLSMFITGLGWVRCERHDANGDNHPTCPAASPA
jgi:hypothetical protein